VAIDVTRTRREDLPKDGPPFNLNPGFANDNNSPNSAARPDQIGPPFNLNPPFLGLWIVGWLVGKTQKVPPCKG